MKLKKLSTFLLLALFTTHSACSTTPEAPESSVFYLFSDNYLFENALDNNPQVTPQILYVYNKMNNKPIWFVDGHLSKQGKMARDVLKNSDQEGLNPFDYEDATQIEDHPEKWVEAEILLTKRFLEFVTHVQIGRIDPMKISDDIKFHSPKKNAADLLLEALNDKNSDGKKLQLMAPILPQYVELKKILAYYKEQAATIKEWPTLVIFKTLKQGDIDSQINTLRRILVLSGDLSKDKETGDVYDAQVVAAMRRFQKRYCLEPDGVVGNKTKEILNYPIKERIKKIIVNMERLRWLPDNLGHKHIIVNVAGYVLYGFDEEEATIMMPVIVGRPDRRTPLFYTTLKNIVLNPFWSVPNSIFIKDKLPRIKNDRGYIQRSNFIITDYKGRVIDPAVADWESEGRKYFLRQTPGRHNALGRIKFNIENPYSIYLHGTPDKALFSKKARPFSSGCIRLKYPRRLTDWVLKNDPQWSHATVKAAIDKGQTKIIELSEDIPVYFTYQTIWVKDKQPNKRLFFSDDPYKLDAKMIKMFNLK